MLSKKEIFSTEVSPASLEHKASVFDVENYDEDEDFNKEPEAAENNSDAQTIVENNSNMEPEAVENTSDAQITLSGQATFIPSFDN